MNDAEHPEPSAHSRRLIEGMVDLHVHIAPDVMERRVTDVELARRFADRNLHGFVLKSHYSPTAERAASVNLAVQGARAYGALTLNGAVGGMNPIAVEIAARSGAKVVWMPTVDSANQRSSSATDPAHAVPAMWKEMQQSLFDKGIAADPIAVLDEDGTLLPHVRAVLQIIAEHGLVLATGHLSRDEIMKVVAAAAEEGVRAIVVTHPEFTSQRLSVEEQHELAGMGAYLERCFTTPYTRKVTWEHMLANIRAVGPEHSILASDLGQPFNPPVEDGVAIMVDKLLAEGFTDEEVRRMTVHNSRRILGLDVELPATPVAL